MNPVLCRSPFQSAAPARPARQVRAAAGFGKSNKKVVDTSGGSYTGAGRRRVDIAEQLSDAPKGQPAAAAAPGTPDLAAGWIEVATMELFAGKTAKPVILATGKAIMLFLHGGKVYCTDASSTAFQYPLADAKVLETPEGPVIEVPLDGTRYFLESGEVALWCPRDSAVRKLLGTLKQVVDPVPLRTYPVVAAQDGRIYSKFV